VPDVPRSKFKPGDKVMHKRTREEGRVLSVAPGFIVVRFNPTNPDGYTVLASDFEKVEDAQQ
jgi:hypothetical protein